MRKKSELILLTHGLRRRRYRMRLADSMMLSLSFSRCFYVIIKIILYFIILYQSRRCRRRRPASLPRCQNPRSRSSRLRRVYYIAAAPAINNIITTTFRLNALATIIL